MANTDKILPGYPQSVGGKIQYILDHAGPASYVTGGESYPVSNIGAGGFDKVESGASFNATSGSSTDVYTVSAVLASGSEGSGVSTVTLKWFTTASTEVAPGTNLNGQYVRLNILAY